MRCPPAAITVAFYAHANVLGKGEPMNLSHLEWTPTTVLRSHSFERAARLVKVILALTTAANIAFLC
jgi:hypothetical protein